MSKRKEKKEQKLREKLKKQGFSQEEIEKLVKAQRKKTTAKVVVGTLATAIVVAGVVFTVATVMKNNNITPTPTPTPTPPPTPTPKPTQEEIEKSKELEEEIKNDVEDKKPEDIDTKIDDKQNELDAAQKELEDLKNNPDASEEEIAAAEEKQKQAEEQLEAAKEEQSYWTTTSRIKELYAENLSNATGYPNSYIREIKDITYNYSDMIVDAEVISKDANGILRQHDVVLKMFGEIPENFDSAQGLSTFFQNCTGIEIGMEFNSSSTELEQDFFNNRLKSRHPNMTLLASNTLYDEEGKISKICVKVGYDFGPGNEYYIFNVARMSKDHTNEEVAEMIKNGEIRASILQGFTSKALIFDWQNATFKYKGQEQSDKQITEEQQTEEQEAEELLNSFSTFDENGELETFDYPAYQQYLQQMQAEKEAKELEQNMTQETKVTYSEQELGF